MDKADILQTLPGHGGIVYSGAWNSRRSLFVSCSDDRTLKSWWWEDEGGLKDADGGVGSGRGSGKGSDVI